MAVVTEDMTCDRCFKPLDEGAHGEGICPYEPRKAALVVSDSWRGGRVMENGFTSPRRFSASEHRKALDEAGLQVAPRYVEGSKTMTRWDAVDLEAARALVSRGTPAMRTADKTLLEPHPGYPIDVTPVGWSVKK